MAITITALTNTDPAFYPTMGPFLASRDVVKSVGDKIWDDDGKTWYIAQENGAVIGFVAVTQLKNSTRMESLYLVEENRREVATALVTAAVADFGHDRDLQVVVIHDHAYAYTEAGFAEIAQVGKNFVKLVRRATVRTTTSSKKGKQ